MCAGFLRSEHEVTVISDLTRSENGDVGALFLDHFAEVAISIKSTCFGLGSFPALVIGIGERNDLGAFYTDESHVEVVAVVATTRVSNDCHALHS